MDNIIPFTPRPRPQASTPLPPGGSTLRAHLEEAAHAVLDAADTIIAALDRLCGSDEADPSLTAMRAHGGQVVQLREPSPRAEVVQGSASVIEATQPAKITPRAQPIILARRRQRRTSHEAVCPVARRA